MTDITILVTGAGTTTALSVLKGLKYQRELAVRTVTVDMSPRCIGRHFSDAFYTVPPAASPDFVDALLDICRREAVDMLVPIVDYEFLPLTRARARFVEAGCRVVISSEETIRTCNQKDLTHLHFAQHGIPAPIMYDAQSVLRQPDTARFPLIIKPRVDGRASIDVHKLEDVEDLAYWGRRVADPLIEEYIAGREFTIDTLSDLDGNVIASVPRERLEVKAGICYKGQTVRHPELIAWGAQVASTLNIVGPANIQCRMDGAEGLKFFEVNPRFGATQPITVAAGVNMPLLLARMVLGKTVKGQLGCFAEVTMLRYWEELFPSDGNACLIEQGTDVTREVAYR